jgi:drug/metabolite transporter (DMT)-like permease
MKDKNHKFKNALLALLLANIIWAASAPVVKLTLTNVPLYTFIFFRFLIVCIAVLPYVYIELKKIKINKSDLINIIILGLFGQTSILLIFAGIDLSTTVDIAILASIGPTLNVIFGRFFFKEYLSPRALLGISITVLGTLVVVFLPAMTNTIGTADTNQYERITGNLLVILYNIFFGLFIILSKYAMGEPSSRLDKVSKKLSLKPMKTQYSPYLITAISFFVALVSFLPFALYENFILEHQSNFLSNLNGIGIFGILYMAIGASIMAYFLFEYGVKYSTTADAALFGYLMPILTFPFSYLLLGEIPSNLQLAGAAIIIFGVFIAETKKT